VQHFELQIGEAIFFTEPGFRVVLWESLFPMGFFDCELGEIGRGVDFAGVRVPYNVDELRPVRVFQDVSLGSRLDGGNDLLSSP
jgi:hypothetical protein